MQVLFDTNVLLDALLARAPFVTNAAFLLEAVEEGKVTGFVSATTMTDVPYLVRRQTKSIELAIVAVTKLLALMEICEVNRGVLERSVALNLSDFEDSVQVACAINSRLDVIVTRDTTGFVGSPISVLLPSELRDQLTE